MTNRKGYLDGCIHFPTWLIYSDSDETAVEPVHLTKKKKKKEKEKTVGAQKFIDRCSYTCYRRRGWRGYLRRSCG